MANLSEANTIVEPKSQCHILDVSSVQVLGQNLSPLENLANVSQDMLAQESVFVDTIGNTLVLDEKVITIIKPFQYLLATTIMCLFFSFMLLINKQIQAGSILGFLSMTLVFLSTYTLWRLNSIALMRPKLILLGFCASLGLLITSLASLLI